MAGITTSDSFPHVLGGAQPYRETGLSDYMEGFVALSDETLLADPGGPPPPPSITVDTSLIDFEQVAVGSSVTQSATFGNEGGERLNVTGMTLNDSNGVYALDFAGGVLPLCGEPPFWLNADDYCHVAITFSPHEAGSYPAELVIQSNDPVAGTLRVPLVGTGVSGPEIEVRVLPFATTLGPVRIGEEDHKEVAGIMNMGTEDLVIDSFQLVEPGGADHFSFLSRTTCPVDSVPATFGPGGGCALYVTFAPHERGDHTAELVITSNDVDEPTVTVLLSGIGRERSLDDLCPTAAAYGTTTHKDLDALRAFRDRYLLTNAPGRALADFYYRLAPPIAAFLTAHPGWRAAARVLLVPIVAAAKYPLGILTLFVMTILGFRLRKRSKAMPTLGRGMRDRTWISCQTWPRMSRS